MPQSKFPLFDQAIRAGQRYVQTSVRARDAQYHFLALTYLAAREGKRRSRAFHQLLCSHLKRQPNRYETQRPFLLILHALLGREEDLPKNAVKHFSKLASALEEIDRAFQDTRPTLEEIIDFVEDAGGVAGLYDLARLGTADSDHFAATSGSVVPLKPSDIPLPAIGGIVTKVGRGYRLRLSDREPGEYFVRLRVGRGGFVEAILEDDAEFVAA